MTRRRGIRLAAVVVLLTALVAAVAVMAVAALPAVLALGLAVLALVAGITARPGRRSARRAGPAPTPADVEDNAPAARPGPDRPRWRASLDSRPSARAVPDTRQRVAAVLAEWGLAGEAVEPTLLVVTELLSNAADHGHGPRSLSLELAEGSVRVEVRDNGPEPPQLQSFDPLRTRGRGLQLVEGLSTEWGWAADPPGKVVWAEVPTRWPA
jgi:anti-sigma regulatory factor (Ser/Thr protein kinase)